MKDTTLRGRPWKRTVCRIRRQRKFWTGWELRHAEAVSERLKCTQNTSGRAGCISLLPRTSVHTSHLWWADDHYCKRKRWKVTALPARECALATGTWLSKEEEVDNWRWMINRALRTDSCTELEGLAADGIKTIFWVTLNKQWNCK